jgi:ribonuclease HII
MATATRRSAPPTSPARTGQPVPRRGSSYAAPAAPGGRARASAWHRPRLDPDYAEEAVLWARGYGFVAGVDEVGRGCLAGPVAAGAVILPRGWLPEGLRDSKMLKPEERERLAGEIAGRALAWAVALVEPGIIDRINILQATLLASQLAAARLAVRPDALLLDGSLLLPEVSVHQRVVIDGDRLCASIAAASIMAKVARDRLMVELDAVYPGYGWAGNKGYAAPEHRAGLRALGLTAVHRVTFASCADVEQATLWEAVGPGEPRDADEPDDPDEPDERNEPDEPGEPHPA